MNRWEPGIPENYRKEDVLTQQELMNMAIAEVKKELSDKGEEVVAVNPALKAVPNIISRAEDKMKFITVRAGAIPLIPRLLPEFGRGMISHAKKHGADCYFAGMGFGSADDTRFNAGLLLRDDEYLCSYDGMKRVDFT